MKNNNGFTLIELLIVLAIISILAVGATAGIRLISGGGSKQAAQKIMNALDQVRMENMTRSESFSLTISKAGEMSKEYSLVVYRDTDILSSQKLELVGGSISYETVDGEMIELGSSKKLEISFRKDTGGIRENSEGKIPSRIIINGSDDTVIIRLATATGKSFIEK